MKCVIQKYVGRQSELIDPTQHNYHSWQAAYGLKKSYFEFKDNNEAIGYFQQRMNRVRSGKYRLVNLVWVKLGFNNIQYFYLL